MNNSYLFVQLLILAPVIMIVTTIHEATRALVSTLLGDDTPKKEKRLTLNPINHFEPIGFLLMLASGTSYDLPCGWGKPVNTNPRLYSNRRPGIILTAVIPSVMNFLFALAINYALKYSNISNVFLVYFFTSLRTYSLYLIAFNFLPVSPFDCLKIVMELISKKNYFAFAQLESIMQVVMIFLLFMGFLAYIINPVFNVLYFIMSGLTF